MATSCELFVNGSTSLQESDPALHELIQKEKQRQTTGIELIASENFTSRAVMEANGSCLTNKYSEGYPGNRYYGGNEIIDQVEALCRERALAAYRLNPEEWGVNVQPYSGSTANFALLTAILNPGDRLMGLDLPAGGHLTHGYYTAKKKISSSSIYFQSLPYSLDKATGLIDYDALEATAKVYMPRLLIAGGSAYARDWDYARMRKIADSVGAMLLMDMAHISGLVAAQEQNDPFPHCDFVTTTTHKSLRGPRAGMIFFRKGQVRPTPKLKEGEAPPVYDYETKINMAVFPACQGGPHNHCIAAVATCLLQVNTPEFKTYTIQVKKNAKTMGEALVRLGHTLITNGTDNHLVLWDLRPKGLTGSKMEKLLDAVHITTNKNTVLGDTSALTPGGIRLGAPAMTSRGLKEPEFEKIAEFLDRAVQIGVKIQETHGKMLKDFVPAMEKSEEIKALRAEVEAFASTWYMPG